MYINTYCQHGHESFSYRFGTQVFDFQRISQLDPEKHLPCRWKNRSLLHSCCSPPSRASTLEGCADVYLCKLVYITTPYTKQSNLNFQTKKNLEVKASSLNLYTPLLLSWRFFRICFWSSRSEELKPMPRSLCTWMQNDRPKLSQEILFPENRTAGKEVSFWWGNVTKPFN